MHGFVPVPVTAATSSVSVHSHGTDALENVAPNGANAAGFANTSASVGDVGQRTPPRSMPIVGRSTKPVRAWQETSKKLYRISLGAHQPPAATRTSGDAISLMSRSTVPGSVFSPNVLSYRCRIVASGVYDGFPFVTDRDRACCVMNDDSAPMSPNWCPIGAPAVADAAVI